MNFEVGIAFKGSERTYVLTPKVLWLCYHRKRSKTAISSTSTKFLKKNFFW